MSRYILLTALLVALSHILTAQITYRVAAESGLSIRNEPGLESERIGVLPQGTQVTLLRTTDMLDSIRDEGRVQVGLWVEVSVASDDVEVKRGYVFDALLERVSPAKGLASFSAFEHRKLARMQQELESQYPPLYLHLVMHYTPIDAKAGRKNYGDSAHERICAFSQAFEGEVEYSMERCQETGLNQVLVLPNSIPLDQVRKLVRQLYEDSGNEESGFQNEWTTPMNYGPKEGGAGCYYEILRSRHRTAISMYCGC